MLNRNETWVGLILGILIPFVGYALLLLIFEQISEAGMFGLSPGEQLFRPRTVMLMAICLNLIPFNIYQRNRKVKVMRGVLTATLVYSLVWALYFGKSILS